MADCAEGLVEFLGLNGRQHGHELLEERVDLDHHALGAKYLAGADRPGRWILGRNESNHFGISLNRILDRMTDFRISEEHHGPADARRYTYEPTFIMRGLSDLHIEFKPI